MIYGAYGYTGRLVAQEAIKRGHTPILAGRNADKLQALAAELGLECVSFDLNDAAAVQRHLANVDLVFHCAGPFTWTATPMRKACLLTGTHYLDVTGEIAVFEETFKQDVLAKQRGILMCSGMGFDVIPTDCLALYVSQKVPTATDLEIGLSIGRTTHGASVGTMKSALEILSRGGLLRRDGKLVNFNLGQGERVIRFSHAERNTIPFPWGDLATAYRTTGIRDITTYMSFHPKMLRLLRNIGPLLNTLLFIKPIRRLAQAWVGWRHQEKKAALDDSGRAYIWAKAFDAKGNAAEAWLETIEAYQFTAVAGVRAVEKVLADSPSGALSPAQVLGADFVLDLPDTCRFDTLDS
jgi:short subunit dehydrogenase-like uncharacterized protein